MHVCSVCNQEIIDDEEVIQSRGFELFVHGKCKKNFVETTVWSE